MERVMQYFKDRMESFDDYYPRIQKEENECNLFHDVNNWLQFFIFMYNDMTSKNNYFIIHLKKEVVNLS